MNSVDMNDVKEYIEDNKTSILLGIATNFNIIEVVYCDSNNIDIKLTDDFLDVDMYIVIKQYINSRIYSIRDTYVYSDGDCVANALVVTKYFDAAISKSRIKQIIDEFVDYVDNEASFIIRRMFENQNIE